MYLNDYLNDLVKDNANINVSVNNRYTRVIYVPCSIDSILLSAVYIVYPECFFF